MWNIVVFFTELPLLIDLVIRHEFLLIQCFVIISTNQHTLKMICWLNQLIARKLTRQLSHPIMPSACLTVWTYCIVCHLSVWLSAFHYVLYYATCMNTVLDWEKTLPGTGTWQWHVLKTDVSLSDTNPQRNSTLWCLNHTYRPVLFIIAFKSQTVTVTVTVLLYYSCLGDLPIQKILVLWVYIHLG